MLTMCPLSRMCGRQRRVIRRTPWTLVSRTVSSSSSLLESKGSRPSPRPALLTRMSRPPRASTACWTKLSQLSGSVTSSSSATSASICSTRRAPPATRAPLSASAPAIAAPIPLEAPVTIAVFPSSPATRRTLARDQRQSALASRCRVLHLQRGMAQAEAFSEQVGQLQADRVAVRARLDEDVRGARREAAADRPHVEVVDVGDLRQREHRLGNVARLRGRHLEQDARRVA